MPRQQRTVKNYAKIILSLFQNSCPHANVLLAMMRPTLSLVRTAANPAMRTKQAVAFVPSPKSLIHKEARTSIVIASSLLQVLLRVMSFATKQPMAAELSQLHNRRSCL